jgi:hypothetical protein
MTLLKKQFPDLLQPKNNPTAYSLNYPIGAVLEFKKIPDGLSPGFQFGPLMYDCSYGFLLGQNYLDYKLFSGDVEARSIVLMELDDVMVDIMNEAVDKHLQKRDSLMTFVMYKKFEADNKWGINMISIWNSDRSYKMFKKFGVVTK